MASEGGAHMKSFIPSGISYSDTSTDDPISFTPYGPDSCFNPDPRSPRHIINRGTTCSRKEAHNAVRFTPKKPACYSNRRSDFTKPNYANQTEARHRQPPEQMGMAPHVNRHRGVNSLPESLTARKAKPQRFNAPPRGKPCSSRYNFSPSTTAAMDLPPSSPSGHSASRGHRRVSYGNPTNQRSPTIHPQPPPHSGPLFSFPQPFATSCHSVLSPNICMYPSKAGLPTGQLRRSPVATRS